MRNLASSLVLLAAASGAVAQSQCFDNALGTFLGSGDDVMLSPQQLPFAFPFGGQTWTTIHPSTNGFLYLSNNGVPAPPAGTGCCNGTAALLTSQPPRIAPYWVDLNLAAANNAGVYVKSSAGFVSITWKNAVEYLQPAIFDVQLQLFSNGTVKMSYSPTVAHTMNNTVLIGMSPGQGVAVPAASDLSAGGAVAVDTIYETWGPAVATDVAGRNLIFQPSAPGLTWTAPPLATTNCAVNAPYGAGCGGSLASFYEHFQTTASIDLSNSGIGMLFTGAGYVVLQGTAAFVAPSATAQNLNLGDDTETSITLSQPFNYVGGSTTTLNIGSNGCISTASNGAAGDYTVTPGEMINWPNTTWAVWRDLIPNATNNVMFEEVGGKAIVTWNGVLGYQGTSAGITPSTFQFQFDFATGNVDIVFLSLDTVSVSGWAGGDGWVVGYSPGGSSLDPGNRDLSATLAASFQLGVDRAELRLSGAGFPVPGATLPLVTANVPAGSPFGAVLVGFVQFNPGIDLTGIGMPGCFQYNDGLGSLLFLAPGAQVITPFAIPPGASVIGVNLLAQSATFSPPLTPLGAISSNGLQLTIGQ